MSKTGSLHRLEWFGEMLSSSSGFRSKSLKVLQYASRLLVWWAENQKRSDVDSATISSPEPMLKGARTLGKAVGSARKIMNLGDCISDYFAMQAAIETAWADPGNATRVRNAVAAVSDFACDATTDWMLLASLTHTDDVSPRTREQPSTRWSQPSGTHLVFARHCVARHPMPGTERSRHSNRAPRRAFPSG